MTAAPQKTLAQALAELRSERSASIAAAYRRNRIAPRDAKGRPMRATHDGWVPDRDRSREISGDWP